MDPSPDVEVDGADESDVAARRTLLLLALALVVVLLGAGLLAVAQHRHDDAARRADVLPDAAGTRAADVGPAVNTDVAGYIAARQQALAAATGTRVAVVSLARYAGEAEARHAVDPVPVVALLVAAPGGLPSTVRGSLSDWAKRQRDQADADFDDVHTIVCSRTVDDPDFSSFYATEEQRLLALATADGSEPVVLGVVVRASVADLRALAKAPGIRLVDVGGGDRFDASAAYRGLRPEEVNVTGQPTAYRAFAGTRLVPACPKAK